MYERGVQGHGAFTPAEQVWKCPAKGCGLEFEYFEQPEPCPDHPFDKMVLVKDQTRR